jgi:hypothetical protein
VLDGRWTFQIVEEFDDHYWSVFREHERHLRNTFQGGVRHVIELEMKERRRAARFGSVRPVRVHRQFSSGGR